MEYKTSIGKFKVNRKIKQYRDVDPSSAVEWRALFIALHTKVKALYKAVDLDRIDYDDRHWKKCHEVGRLAQRASDVFFYAMAHLKLWKQKMWRNQADACGEIAQECSRAIHEATHTLGSIYDPTPAPLDYFRPMRTTPPPRKEAYPGASENHKWIQVTPLLSWYQGQPYMAEATAVP